MAWIYCLAVRLGIGQCQCLCDIDLLLSGGNRAGVGGGGGVQVDNFDKILNGNIWCYIAHCHTL